MVGESDQVLLDHFQHQMGSHCASTGMRDILEYHGLRLSEEMCFGLGCGLNFVYWRAPFVPFFLVIGRGNQIEVDICEFLGIQIDVVKSEDDVYAWNLLKAYLDHEMPVLVDVDMTHLEYLRKKIQMIDGVRFGGHKVNVIGYDLNERVVHLSDYAWNQTQTISMEDFIKSRNSKVEPTPPENTVYAVHPFKRTVPLPTAVRNAIRVNTHRMLHSWDRAVGLRGVEKLAKEVLRWPRIMDEEQLKMNAFVSYMMLEAVGTGGGAFRRMYSRFLREASDLLNMPELRCLSSDYVEIASLWTQVAKLFQASSRSAFTGMFSGDPALQDLLNELARKERDAVEQLSHSVNQM